MRLLRWIFVSFPLLLVLIATLFWGLLHSIDRKVYQQALEMQISRLTGRVFRIKGALNIELLPRPALVAGGVNLANASWGSRKQMLKLGHLRMELALRPLLDGRISITRVAVSELDLLLEKSPEGLPNWHFNSEQTGRGQQLLGDGFSLWDIRQVLAHKAKLTIKSGNAREPVYVRSEALQLQALNRTSPLNINLKGEALGRSFIFSGAMENMSRLLANEAVTFRGKFIHQNSELNLQGHWERPLDMENPRLTLAGGGPELAEIIPDLPAYIASLPYQFGFSARADDSRWILDGIRLRVGKNSVSGNLTINPAKAQGQLEALTMAVEGPKVGVFFPALAPEIIPYLSAYIGSLPYQFEFSAKTDASRWVLDGIHLIAGENSASGSLIIDPGKEKGQLEALTMAFEGPKIGAFFPELPSWVATLPYQLFVMASGDLEYWKLNKLQLKAGSNDLTGNGTVDWSGKRPRIVGELHSVGLEFPPGVPTEKEPLVEHPTGKKGLFSTEEIGRDALSWVDGNLTATVQALNNAVLPIRNLQARLQLENGQLQLSSLQLAVAEGTLTASGSIKSAGFALKAKAKKLDLPQLTRQLGVDAEELGGKVDFAFDLKAEGHSPAMLAGSLNGDVKVLLTDGHVRAGMHDYLVGGLSSVLGALFSKQSDTSKIHCAVAHMRFQQGVGKSILLAVDTEHSLLKGEGELNLREESLDFLVTPKPKGVTLNLGVPLTIQGPMRKPTVTPQALGAARKIGGLLGIIFFPPAALLGLGELGAGESPACSKMLGEN